MLAGELVEKPFAAGFFKTEVFAARHSLTELPVRRDKVHFVTLLDVLL